MKLQRAVATRIVNLLNQQHLTRYALCKKIALAESTLKNIIDENYRNIKLNTLANIADGFGLTLIEFFDDPLFARHNLEID